jgi:hypothetical protein
MTDTPDGPLIEQLEIFGHKIDTATEEIVALTQRLDLIKTKADTAARNAATAKKYAVNSRRLARIGVAALVVAIAVGIASVSNRGSIEGIEETRTASRKVTCNDYNKLLDAIELKVNSGASNALLALVPPDTPLTPEQEARIAAYNAALEADNSLDPLRRDCTSKAAIDAWYEGKTP